MTAASTAPVRSKRVQPGRQKRELVLTKVHLALLRRLASLRVMTAEQAHWLFTPFSSKNSETGDRKTESNTRKRLAALVKNRYISTERIRPDRGAYSKIYYRLANRGLVAIGRAEDTRLITRPPQHVLEYLLFRNSVYAEALASGWLVATPVLHPPSNHGALLARFGDYVRAQWAERIRVLEQKKVSANAVAMEKADFARIDKELPSALTFDFLVRFAPGAGPADTPSDVVLVVVHDPRRAIVREKLTKPKVKASSTPCAKCSKPTEQVTTFDRRFLRCTDVRCNAQHIELEPPAKGQLEDLPKKLAMHGVRLLLRDHRSRFNVITKELTPTDELARWRTALASKYGEQLLATDTLFPELWAERVGEMPKQSTRQASPQSNPKEAV